MNGENRSTRFQDSGQKKRKVFDARAGGEEEHRLFRVLPNELDEAGKLLGRLAHHEEVVKRERSRVLGRGVTCLNEMEAFGQETKSSQINAGRNIGLTCI